MEMQQIRYFLALCKCLNFTRAAETCNVSQPAFTRAIQRLEDEVGGPLLYRERNLTQLTPLGKSLLPHLEAALAATEEAVAHAAAFRRRESAPLRLGVDSTLSMGLLSPVLCELQDRIKGFELTMAMGRSTDLFTGILAGELDAAVAIKSEMLPENLNWWPLFRDRYAVLLPVGHRLTELEEIPLGKLAGESVVGRSAPGSDCDVALNRWCGSARVELIIRHRGYSEEQIQLMVAAGLGVALSAAHELIVPGIIARPLAHPEANYHIIVTAAAGRQHGPGVATFLKLMRARDWTQALKVHKEFTGLGRASK